LAPEKNAIALAEKLRALLSDTNLQVVGKVTASFGVASFSEHDSVDSLYQRADDGMYQAKNNGRNAVCFVPIT
jgi:diguanylate cyclase (GGDEF)-like protein